LLSEAQPKNAVVNPPPQIWKRLQPARITCARRLRDLFSNEFSNECFNEFFNELHNKFFNFTMNFTILKLRSTTEQMPALVLPKYLVVYNLSQNIYLNFKFFGENIFNFGPSFCLNYYAKLCHSNIYNICSYNYWFLWLF
jgi:hypothetical protein